MSTEIAVSQIQKVEANIASAQQDFAALSLKLANDPSNALVNEQLNQIENEISDYRKAIARLEGAAKEAARQDTKAARKARFAQLKGQRDRLALSNATTEALASKLQTTFGDLALLFAKLQRAVEDRSADAHAILAGTRGKNFHADSEGNAARLARFNTGEITESLAHLVADTGITTGIPLEPYVIVTAPLQLAGVTGTKHSLGAAVAKANTRLLAAIDSRIASAKALLLA